MNLKLLGGLLVAGIVGAQAQLLDGGFEEPEVGGSYVPYWSGSNLGGWVVENGTVEIVGTYWQAAEGDQSLDLSGIWDYAGTIYQDVATEAGKYYVLRFAFAGNPEDGAVKEAKLFWNDQEIAHLTVDTAGRSLQDMGWKYYRYVVKAEGASSRIKFQSLTMNFLGPVIDDVSLFELVPNAELTVALYPGITVRGQPGAFYRVEYKAEGETWAVLETVKMPSNGETFVVDKEPAKKIRRVYRVVMVE